ncbi:hypothetical protein ACFVZL_19885 [Streptomyces sp. NPDC058320]|uniref:hypothetical protein n=1 Tax=unclassified Streptomyces TaxID=2593676 RepID=UPI00362A99B8
MTARRRCAVCDRPLTGKRGRPCIRGCGAHLCRATHIPHCTDVHGGQCPNHQLPDDGDHMNESDYLNVGALITAAALDDDVPAVRMLLRSLPPEQIAAAVEGGVLAMAGLVREVVTPEAIQNAAREARALAIQAANERN